MPRKISASATPRRKSPAKKPEFLLDDTEVDDVIPVAPKRRMTTIASSRVHPKGTHLDVHKGAQSVPVLHTMPMAIDRKHFWHVALEDYHYDWLGRLLATMVVAAGVLMFLVSPVLHGSVLTFLQPWSKPAAVVIVPPAPKTIPVSTVVTVSTKVDPLKPEILLARQVEAQATASAEFVTTGKVTTTDSRAGGTVKIVNTTDRAFTFVATTRVLSKDGILFRLTKPVSLPAKKTVVAEVLADKPGIAGDIGPTVFTLPGLPTAELREQIYAVSEVAMVGGTGERAVVTESDLTRAKVALQAQLAKDAQNDLQALTKPEEKLLSGLVTSTEGAFVAPKVGAFTTSFEAKLDGIYKVMLFSEQSAVAALQSKVAMQRGLVDGSKLEMENVKFIVQAYDVKSGVAEIRVEAEVAAE